MTKRLITILTGAAFICGCVGSRVWTRAEVQTWYATWIQRADGSDSGLGYQGSDETMHYFITRSIDSWVSIRVRRDEINVPEERPYQNDLIGPVKIYYWVDPTRSFTEKKPVEPRSP